MPILAHWDFIKPRSKLVGWILFAAGVWAFSKGGLEGGGGEGWLIFCGCYFKKKSVIFIKSLITSKH